MEETRKMSPNGAYLPAECPANHEKGAGFEEFYSWVDKTWLGAGSLKSTSQVEAVEVWRGWEAGWCETWKVLEVKGVRSRCHFSFLNECSEDNNVNILQGWRLEPLSLEGRLSDTCSREGPVAFAYLSSLQLPQKQRKQTNTQAKLWPQQNWRKS